MTSHNRELLIARRGLLAGAALLVAGCEPQSAAVPTIRLSPVEGLQLVSGAALPPIDTSRFADRITLVNVWATWCPYCRSEHDTLLQLAREQGFVLAGLVYRDSPDNVRRYLASDGNPYAELSMDSGGTLSAALGVRGVPTTLVIGRDRKIALRHVGPLNPDVVRTIVAPAIARTTVSVQS